MMHLIERDRIRVLLVDDHAMVRRGLEAFLSSFDDIEIVGEARDGAEAIRMCEQLQPDVVGKKTIQLATRKSPHLERVSRVILRYLYQ